MLVSSSTEASDLVPNSASGTPADTGSRTARRYCRALLIGIFLLAIAAAHAAGFEVISADTRLQRGVYLLDARIEYDFSKVSLEALDNGVPLTLRLEMEVVRRREWLWDETVASLQQRFRLEYHALARQYLVVNLNNGELRSFPTWGTAADFLGRIKDFPLLDSSLLEAGDRYFGRMRASLDLEALPPPLRLIAYLTKRWRLTSDWYEWPL